MSTTKYIKIKLVPGYKSRVFDGLEHKYRFVVHRSQAAAQAVRNNWFHSSRGDCSIFAHLVGLPDLYRSGEQVRLCIGGGMRRSSSFYTPFPFEGSTEELLSMIEAVAEYNILHNKEFKFDRIVHH